MAQQATNIFKHDNFDYSTLELSILQLLSEYYNANLFDPTALDIFVESYPMSQAEIEKVTKATGIKTAVDIVSKGLNIPCGCEGRKDALNKIFPYKQK